MKSSRWLSTNTSSQTNSRSLESESQGNELRFSFVTRSPKDSFSHLIWTSLHRLTHVLNSVFLLLANFSSFFKIPLKFCLLWEDTSTTPNIKSMLTHFSLSEYFIFIPLWLYLLHFAVWVLPFSMPSVSIASNIQEDWHTESGMNCAGQLGYIWSRPYGEVLGSLRMRQLPPLRDLYVLPKSSSPFSFWAALLALWLRSPGTQYNFTTLTRFLGRFVKHCVSQGQSCIFFISVFTAHILSDSPELLYDLLS